MTIDAPRHGPDHPDRHIDCQKALERAFQILVEGAVNAGWTEAEAVAAIVELADAHVLAAGENAKLEQLLADIRKKAGK